MTYSSLVNSMSFDLMLRSNLFLNISMTLLTLASACEWNRINKMLKELIKNVGKNAYCCSE
jgi:hypothetical protein